MLPAIRILEWAGAEGMVTSDDITLCLECTSKRKLTVIHISKFLYDNTKGMYVCDDCGNVILYENEMEDENGRGRFDSRETE